MKDGYGNMARIVRIEVWRKSSYKTVFIGYFSSFEYEKIIKKLFPEDKFIVLIHIIEDDDDEYYLDKARLIAGEEIPYSREEV